MIGRRSKAIKEKNKPKIVTYFKTVSDSSEVEDEVRAFMEMLDVDLHYYYSFAMEYSPIRMGW